jgi:acetoacetyl-CoA synthetase
LSTHRANPGLDDVLRDRVAATLRARLSPRHVPARIIEVPAVPRTLTGKKTEVPVKRILQGKPPEAVVAGGALADPESLRPYVALAQRAQPSAGAAATRATGGTAGPSGSDGPA